MKILKCLKCGNVIHEFDNCLFCGNQSDFLTLEEPKVHPNAQNDYILAQEMVAKGDFISAEVAIDSVIRWSPSISEVRWLRFLIKNKCRSDVELLCRGFSADENADYGAAIAFANETQKAVYSSFCSVVESMKSYLTKTAEVFTSQAIIALEIPKRRKEMQFFFTNKRRSLITKWGKVQQLEEMLKRYESDGQILSQEFIEYVKYAKKNMLDEKDEIDHKKEIYSDEYKVLVARFDAISNSSDDALHIIEQFEKNNQYVVAATSLIQQRRVIEDEIADEIRELHKYERDLDELIRTVERLNDRCETVKGAIKAGNYTPAHELLGDQLFARVLKSVLRFSRI